MSVASTASSFRAMPQNGGSTTNQKLLLSQDSRITEKEGLLVASILSVYDLPSNEPPTNVTLMACGMTVWSGPPLARHKDKNSFRFSSPAKNGNGSNNGNDPSSTVKIVAPLRDLYKSTLTIRVVYGNDKNSNNQSAPKTLQTEYDIRQLRIHESKWLILNLSPESETGLVNTVLNPENVNDDEDVPPTIRLKLHLSGPYRPEIAALVTAGQSWFGLVDHLEGQASKVLQPISEPMSGVVKTLSIPTIPLVTILVVVSPVIAGIVMVTMPFLLPVVLAVLIGAVGIAAAGTVGYASTKQGRKQVGSLLAPVTESLVSSRSGQTFLYDTGPRPTPVSVLRPVLPTSIWSKLVLSLTLDLIGSASYLLPIVGEFLDVAWAPTQTIFVMAMYDTISPNLKFVSFAEEILPFTDIVPAATIGWALEFGPSLMGNSPVVTQAASQLANGVVPFRQQPQPQPTSSSTRQ